MALTNTISADVVVQIQDRGPVDGSPATLSIVTVTTLARRLMVNSRVGKAISVSGFGTADNFRPGKTSWEATLALLVSYSAQITAVAGNYMQLEYTLGTNTEQKDIGILMSSEISVDDDGEVIQTLTLQGPVDGGVLV